MSLAQDRVAGQRGRSRYPMPFSLGGPPYGEGRAAAGPPLADCWFGYAFIADQYREMRITV